MAIKFKFVHDEAMDDVEIIIKAKSQNKDVEKILNALSDTLVNKKVIEVNEMYNDIDINDIIIISKQDRYLFIKTVNGKYVINQPLYKMEEVLDQTWFVKISQSEIVNLKYVKKWNFDKGGIILIELSDGTTSYTSRRCASHIKEILKKGGNQK